MSSIYTYNRTKDIHSHKISGKMNKRMRIRTGRDIISSVSQQIFNIDNGSVSIHLLLTLNVRGLNTQIKRFLITDKKIQLFAVCKKLTSLLRTQRKKVKGGNDIISKWSIEPSRSSYFKPN